MKTYITSGILIVISAVLGYLDFISVDVSYAVICYLIIQIPKRDTQRKIEKATKMPHATVSRFMR